MIRYRTIRQLMTISQKHLAMLEGAEQCGQSDTAGLRLCFELLAAADAIDRDCASRLASYQLSESKFLLIFLLHGRADGLPSHALAEQSGVTRATITRFVDELERDGFVVRHQGNKDRSSITILFTEKGERSIRFLFGKHIRWIRSLCSDLGQEESRTLDTLLRRMWIKTQANERNSAITMGGDNEKTSQF